MKLSLARKLYGIVGFILIVLAGISLASYLMMHTLVAGFENLDKEHGAQVTLGLQAADDLGQAVQAYKNYLLRRDDKYVEEFRTSVTRIRQRLDNWEKLAEDDEARALVRKCSSALDPYEHSIDALVEARRGTDDIAAVDRSIKGVDRPVRAALEEMVQIARTNYERREKAIGSSAAAMVRAQIIAALVALLAGVGLSIVVVSRVMTPIRDVATAAADGARGIFTHDVSVRSEDEVGEMARDFNQMVKKLRDVVSKIEGMTSTLASSSEEISAATSQVTSGLVSQAGQIDQVAAATTEVSQTIMDVAKNSSEASKAAKESVDTATSGKVIVQESAQGMQRIAKTVEDSARTIGELGKGSEQIGEIVNVIQDIADQTNLLALNAAIEAARAGDQGRGFAVVADEVRKLAERTAKATGEISKMIAKIQKDTDTSVKSMMEGRTRAAEGLELIEKATRSLDQIVETSERCQDIVRQIATATEEESSAIEEVSATMEAITNVARMSQSAVTQTSTAINDLARLAAELKEMMAWFKMDDRKRGGGDAHASGDGGRFDPFALNTSPRQETPRPAHLAESTPARVGAGRRP